MKKNRFKLLVSNLLVYGVGGVVSKAIPLIMVPIITRLMPNTSYYGISDLCTTVIQLFTAFAVIGMYDAMYRYFFEKEDKQYKMEICSTALFFTILTSIIVSAIMVAFNGLLSSAFFSNSNYGNLVILCAISVFVGATNSIISAPTRMQNKKLLYLVGNVLSPIIAYSIAIPLLLNGFYLLALPISTIVSAVFIEVYFYFLNHKWFKITRIRPKYIWPMLIIALPLLPNFIIYWVFNSCDRVMITNILGADYSGIYAAASKIGHLSNLFYTAFAGGWQFFAFSVMKDKDNVRVISIVFEVLTVISLVSGILMTAICKPLVHLLFTQDYYSGFMCVPYLFLAPLLFMLYQIGTTQFITIKKTWPNMIIIGFGAFINIALNLILIPRMGIEGASLATFVGYIVSIFGSIILQYRFKILRLNKKYFLVSLLFMVFFVMMRFNNFSNNTVNIVVSFLFLSVSLVMYKPELMKIINKVFRKKSQ